MNFQKIQYVTLSCYVRAGLERKFFLQTLIGQGNISDIPGTEVPMEAHV